MTSFDLSGSPLAILLRNSHSPIPPRNQLLLSEVWEVIAVDPSSRSTFVDRILRRWWCPRCPLQMRQSFGASLTPLRLVQHVPTFRPRHSVPRCFSAPHLRGREGFEGGLQIHPQTDHLGSRDLDCLHCVSKFLAVIKDMKFLDLAFFNHIIVTGKAV